MPEWRSKDGTPRPNNKMPPTCPRDCRQGFNRITDASEIDTNLPVVAALIPKLPKVLLHTHLEGSLPRSTLALLSRRNQKPLPFNLERESMLRLLRNGGWPAFAEIIRAVFACFQQSQDFNQAVLGYANSLARQNIVYVEIHCSPWKHFRRGVPLEAIETGLVDGIRAAAQQHAIQIRMICDFVRDADEDADFLLDWVTTLPRSLWPAIGISGGLKSTPLIEMRKICEKAHSRGFRVVVHAGELSSADSVRTAVFQLNADRICHGVRILEDQALAADIVERRIHLELCPTANHILGVGLPYYGSIARLLQMNANCSINSDDELLFGTCLAQEYTALARSGIIRVPDLLSLQRNALYSAFITHEERCARLLGLLSGWERALGTCGELPKN